MNMFKKDDHIVVLKDSSCENNWQNFVVKQIENHNAIMPVITPLGRDNSDCDHSYSNFKEKDDVWRYADEEEIEEYDRLGKPFNVIKFNNFTLPGNWHIVVTEENAEDVLKWRFESSYSYKDKADYSDNLVGIAKEDNCYHKGHNPKTEIIGDTYDFGIEITYQQFKKYVLNQSPVKHKYLTELLEKLKVK